MSNVRRIYKYPLHLSDIEKIDLPIGAKILCVQAQVEQPCIWALVDPEAPDEQRTFVTVGTGHRVDGHERLTYIDTFQLRGGSLVFHVFEV